MGMVMSTASTRLAIYTSRMMTGVNVALMDKALDLVEVQGEAVQEMMELPSSSFHALDIYAWGAAL